MWSISLVLKVLLIEFVSKKYVHDLSFYSFVFLSLFWNIFGSEKMRVRFCFSRLNKNLWISSEKSRKNFDNNRCRYFVSSISLFVASNTTVSIIAKIDSFAVCFRWNHPKIILKQTKQKLIAFSINGECFSILPPQNICSYACRK